MIGTATLSDGPHLSAPVKILKWRTATFGDRCAIVETLPGGKGGWAIPGKRLTVNARLLSDIVETVDERDPEPTTTATTAEAAPVEGDKYAEVRAASVPLEGDSAAKAATRRQLAALVTRIDELHRRIEGEWVTRPGCVNTRAKQHTVRYNAALRRTARAFEELRQLETSAHALILRLKQADPIPVTPETLATARFVRDRHGFWYEVVRVNRVTVKVVVDPGWNDLAKISNLVEVR